MIYRFEIILSSFLHAVAF